MLVTRSEYKAYAGIKSDTQDSAIDILVPKVSALIKSYCNRGFNDFVEEPKVEVFSGGHSFYMPKELPILNVISLQASDDYGKTYYNLTKFTDYVVDEQNSTIYPLTGEFKYKVNGYRLNYFAGYEVLPEDLKLVVFDLITYYLKNDAVSHQQKTNVSGSLQLEYLTNAQFPAHIARILNLYKQSWD